MLHNLFYLGKESTAAKKRRHRLKLDWNMVQEISLRLYLFLVFQWNARIPRFFFGTLCFLPVVRKGGTLQTMHTVLSFFFLLARKTRKVDKGIGRESPCSFQASYKCVQAAAAAAAPPQLTFWLAAAASSLSWLASWLRRLGEEVFKESRDFTCTKHIFNQAHINGFICIG